jgi:hypothetical protein
MRTNAAGIHQTKTGTATCLKTAMLLEFAKTRPIQTNAPKRIF